MANHGSIPCGSTINFLTYYSSALVSFRLTTLVILVWMVTGQIFHLATGHLVINIGTTQLKLDEFSGVFTDYDWRTDFAVFMLLLGVTGFGEIF